MTNRISHALPAPEHCDACASVNVVYTTNAVMYGRDYGDWPKCYYCQDCRAMVGCHPGTDIPLGRMANAKTRALRAKAHEAFDPIWRSGVMGRTKAYGWLANALGIDVEVCHISWLTNEQLIRTAEVAKEYYDTIKDRAEDIADRRKAKKRAKAIKQNNKIRRKIQLRRQDR